MPLQLLTTKLHRPQVRPDLTPRPHLIQQLNAGLAAGCKLTLISAPAGYGKTTLVTQWLRQLDLPSAWLSLDEGDNDPDRFLSYVRAALQQAGVKIGKTTLDLPLASPSLELLMTELINEIAATPLKFILVLDDFDAIEAEPIHQALNFLIEHLPAHMHLALTTRVDPALNLSRLRVRGQMTEIRTADLRFSEAEVALFFNRLIGFNLRPEELSALENRTEGWAAGLHLLALSMQGRPNLPEFITSFAGDDRYLLDYLTEEVLRRQPETIQTFFLRTSILKRLCGPLCDWLLRNGESVNSQAGLSGQEVLEYLERHNLFIVPLDNKRQWYRYHQVFADFLYHRLRQTEPDRLSIAHGRAALWFEQQGLFEEAIDHALAAPDFRRAAALIEQNFEAMLRRNETKRLTAWLQKLPETFTQTHPLLPLAWAWLYLIQAQFDQAEAWVQKTEAALAVSSPGFEPGQTIGSLNRHTIVGHIQAIRATVAMNLGHEPARVITLAQAALDHLPADDQLIRGVTALNLGDAYTDCNEIELARQAFSEAILLSRDAGYTTVALAALGSQGALCERQAELSQAAEIYQQAITLGTTGDAQDQSPLPATGKAYIFLSRVLHEWNELETALSHGIQGIECCKRWGHLGHLFDGYLQLARTHAARHELAGAQTALAAAKLLISQATATWRAAQPIPNYKLNRMAVWLTAQELQLALKQDQVDIVKRWAQEHGNNPPEFQFQFILARLWLIQGRFGQAARLLATLRQESETTRQIGRLLKSMILQAAALQGQADIVQARLVLTQALRLAEPGGYIRSFADESVPVIELLRQVMQAIPSSDYTARLLAAMQADRQALPLTGQPFNQPAEPLSERELEVLRLVAINLSNQEIAGQLVVSLNTVKTHLKRLYAKLDARNRLEAIERARRLGLL